MRQHTMEFIKSRMLQLDYKLSIYRVNNANEKRNIAAIIPGQPNRYFASLHILTTYEMYKTFDSLESLTILLEYFDQLLLHKVDVHL